MPLTSQEIQDIRTWLHYLFHSAQNIPALTLTPTSELVAQINTSLQKASLDTYEDVIFENYSLLLKNSSDSSLLDEFMDSVHLKIWILIRQLKSVDQDISYYSYFHTLCKEATSLLPTSPLNQILTSSTVTFQDAHELASLA